MQSCLALKELQGKLNLVLGLIFSKHQIIILTLKNYIFPIELIQYMHQQGMVILHINHILLKFLPNQFGNTEFLTLYKTFKHDTDGNIHVIIPYNLS